MDFSPESSLSEESFYRDKMVTKRIRSEYMKKFKDPKWETYSKCYEEMLKYRLTRRLLEHSHNPWFWSGSDSDSDSGQTSPAAPSKNQYQNQVQADPGRDGPEAELEECAGARMDRQQEGMQSRTTVSIPRLPNPEEDGDTGHSKNELKLYGIILQCTSVTVLYEVIYSSQAVSMMVPERSEH